MINVESIKSINSYESFIHFLENDLSWPIPYDVKPERLTYEYYSDELRLSEQDLKLLEGSNIKQLVPLQENQPWGIFLLELSTPIAYKTLLRKVIRSLVHNKHKSAAISSWNHENILFICTCKYQSFTFARFEGEHHANSKITTFGWAPDEPVRTLCEHNLPALKWPQDDGEDADKWLKCWASAFDVEKVTKKFYESYKYVLREILEKTLTEANKDKEVSKRKIWAFAQQLLNRMMFIYFLQKKNWIKWGDGKPDNRYLSNLWKKYSDTVEKDEFYKIWLSSLFFHAFTNRKSLFPPKLLSDIRASYLNMPFLNGGLFEPNELDQLELSVPDKVFESIYDDLLDHYNFTIKEDTPLDIEVAVDPEMLGKVYESLVFESERSAGGIFYTPREEINLMSKMSLIEFLSDSTDIDKDKLISFVMEPFNESNLKQLTAVDARNISQRLENVKVVDPAAGSGSFLVRMMDILVELASSIQVRLGEHPNIYALKRRIIQENLYGVDIKRWAIRVAELRLWLSLIIEADEHELDRYNVPLLPNFSFKLRQGDALIDEVAGVPVSIKKFASITPSLKKKIEEISEKKFLFYQGDKSVSKVKIEKDESDLLLSILDSKITQINANIEQIYDSEKKAFMLEVNQQLELLETERAQEDLFSKKKEEKEAENKKRIEKLRLEKKNIEDIKQAVKSRGDKDYFLWDVDFADVFFRDKQGFDIVIGNPPYVRQEEIAPPLKLESDYSSDDWRAVKKEYKEQLANSVKELWDSAGTINKKSDLYVYFYYQGLSLLNEGGTFCFINSNSWLDVGYGEGLQKFLLIKMQPNFIIDNSAERSFESADVNTVIVMIQRPAKDFSKDYPVKFINFKKPFKEVATTANILKINSTNCHSALDAESSNDSHAEIQSKIIKTDDYRIYVATPQELWLDGQTDSTDLLDWENQEYKGGKWGGKYLRAPDIYFTILKKGKDKLVRLGNIAEVRRGFTTGANELFYLEPTGESSPGGLIHVKNSAGWQGYLEEEFLKPILKSPREVKTIEVKLENLRYKVLMCNKSKEELRKEGKTYVLEYIAWGEESVKVGGKEMRAFHKRPTCASRNKWWQIGAHNASAVGCNYLVDDRMRFYFCKDGFLMSDNFHEIHLIATVEAAFLNSTITILFAELQGRTPFGGGLLKIQTFEAEDILLLDKKILTTEQKEVIDNRFIDDLYKPITNIFIELGLIGRNREYSSIDPNDVSLDKVLTDRRALDKIIFEAIGLTDGEQLEVYKAVVDLVKSRLTKAQTF